MQFSYDYSELIRELTGEIEDNMLTEDDTIQILRGECIGPVIFSGMTKIIAYKTIVDWYYDKDFMLTIMEEDPTDIPDDDVVDRSKIQSDYEMNAPLLEEITVRDCLNEMRSMSEFL
jgi:hypothetical protein